MKLNFLKTIGILIAAIALGLNVQTSLTGYGLKGNKNLNPDVLADASSGSGTVTGSGSTPSNGYEPTRRTTSMVYGDEYTDSRGWRCRNFTGTWVTDCPKGTKSSCNSGLTGDTTGTDCYDPKTLL